MPFCLTKEMQKKFRKDLKNKNLNLLSLMNLPSSEARINIFKEYFPEEEAKKVNLLFEKKIILKNKIRGVQNWMEQVGGIVTEKKQKMLDSLEKYKAEMEQKIMSPKDDEAFFQSLAEQHTRREGITREQAKELFELNQERIKLEKNYNPETEQWVPSKEKTALENKIDYGNQVFAVEKYKEYLATGDETVLQIFKNKWKELGNTWETNKPKAIFKAIGSVLKIMSDTSINIVSTLDDSFLGSQGLAVLRSHPTAWAPAAKESISDIIKTLVHGGDQVEAAAFADVYSDPLFLNGAFKTAGIVDINEEAFPSSLPARIPFVGTRILKASELAFKLSALRMRTKTFSILYHKAKELGVDVTDKNVLEDYGRLVNSLSARGQWGKRGTPSIVKLILWAPNKLKGAIDVMTMHGFGSGFNGNKSGAFREAQKDFIKMIAFYATIISLVNAIKPGTVEIDPRSSDFGKIKVGNTRYDITGGYSSVVTLMARLAMGVAGFDAIKHADGTFSKMNNGYMGKNALELLYNFLENKTAPPTHVLVDILKGKTFSGEKPTVIGELRKLYTPLISQDIEDSFQTAPEMVGLLTNFFGINSNTYGLGETNWDTKETKEMERFKKRVSEDTFKEANDKYNEEVNIRLSELITDEEYQKKSNEDKQKAVAKIKKQVKNEILTSF